MISQESDVFSLRRIRNGREKNKIWAESEEGETKRDRKKELSWPA